MMDNSNVVDLCSDDETEQSSSARRAPMSRQFWKAGSYKVPKGQCHRPNQGLRNHMRAHPDFLHSNATSHKWAFGAIAELFDNAVDEIQNGATYVTIDKTSTPWDGVPALLIQDDGGGMDPEAIRHCMSFGFTEKSSKSTIGQYGNGFKTSSIRLGADAIVFTRHRSLTQSVGLLSYTFLRRMGYDEILVPTVDYEFNVSSQRYGPLMQHSEQQFYSNLAMLLQWSPYSSEELLLKQFDDIGHHGTKVVIYNLWSNDDGNMELDFDSDTEDIRICSEKRSQNWKTVSYYHVANQFKSSLRVYASILYWRLPKFFKIKLRGRDVKQYNIALDLKFPEIVEYRPHGSLKSMFVTKIGFLKEAPHVKIHGFCIYHRNRLILPFWPALKQRTDNGRGVVGVLEANFIQPTHNKQDFEKTPLFQRFEDRLKQMTSEYWNLHHELIGYPNHKRKPPVEMKHQESSSSGTRECLYQPELLNHGSQYECLGASLSTVGNVEDSEVRPLNISSRGLKRSNDIHKVSSQEGVTVPREDLDLPVNVQNAKRHMGSCRPHSQQSTDSAVSSEKATLMQANKTLHSRLSASAALVEELTLQAQQLKSELDSVLLEHTMMLYEIEI